MKLRYETHAAAALLRMPVKDARALRDKLELFAADPLAPHPWAKAFGAGTGRIRHGDWRALYRIDGSAITVVVVKIGNRKDVYR
ncbi:MULTISPECIES: type II toxin-antitoxin system RelE/ParE family toxin [unclassified Azospirillum]|uniref:type II toxin-antitoxin system RelE family toxin n=1 Tax=unclassified Azospirillum TaxID=2630922 RepID=UPI000B76E797|nr:MULTISPECIES: type II toxin-antitoxin system RelE/ParE family toxin [unclassified Azospirillum]